MGRILTLDIGNTNITAGVFEDAHLVKKSKIPTRRYALYGSRLRGLLSSSAAPRPGVDSVVISSVVPLVLSKLIACLKKRAGCRISVIGKDLNVPIKNLYRNKKQVGQDRLVNAYAAKTIYGAPCVIIDFGTAITFDIVSKKGEYLGGLILPGIEMSLSGLYEKTALLPRVELKRTAHIIGKDTAESMRAGILFGFGAMCDALVSRYRKIIGSDIHVIATGGNAGLMKEYGRSIRIVDEDLTLKGLHLVATRLSRAHCPPSRCK